MILMKQNKKLKIGVIIKLFDEKDKNKHTKSQYFFKLGLSFSLQDFSTTEWTKIVVILPVIVIGSYTSSVTFVPMTFKELCWLTIIHNGKANTTVVSLWLFS